MEQESYTTAEAVRLCGAVLSSISHGERDLLSGPDLVFLMGATRRLSDRVVSLASVVTDQVARRKAADSSTGTPLTSLIGMDEGRDSSEAARQVFDARDVNAHERVRDLALDGSLSPRHAAAITKGMGQLPSVLTAGQKDQAEQSFIRRASRNTPKALAGLADQVLAEVAPGLVPERGDEDAAIAAQRRRARATRHFRWGDDGDGSVWFKGSLPHLEAAPLIAVVRAYVESDRRAERTRLKATRSTQPDPKVVQDQVSDDNFRTPVQRQADAIAQVIADHRDGPTSLGDRPRIVVTIREQDLRELAEEAGVLASGAKIIAGDLRRLCCDADLMPVVLGSHSEILDVGRTNRLVTAAIRRALTLRDGGCIFPDCDAPDARCEAHHLQPWWAGGDTALHNLVLLCPFHHKLVEPNREDLAEEHEPARCGSPGQSEREHHRRSRDRWRIHIDSDTGQPVIVSPLRTTEFIGRDNVARGVPASL